VEREEGRWKDFNNVLFVDFLILVWKEKLNFEL
jgi:hypothetical protein